MGLEAMRRTLACFLVWAHLAWLVVPVARAQTSSDNETLQKVEEPGFLRVTSTRAGTEIWLNDRLLGIAPLDSVKVSAGHHRLVAINPDKTSWLDRDWVREIDIRSGQVTEVNVVFQKYYSVNSIPFGAQVLVDGRPVGDTPAIISVPDTTAAVEVVLLKQGFLPDTLRLDAWSGRFRQVELRPKPGAAVLSGFSGSAAEAFDRSRKWTYISAGVGLLSGVTALYFKRRADDTYDRYMKAIEPAEIERLYKRTRQLDSYAAISFGVFQLSFVSTLYFFLKSVNR
jgi:hypothetical protein